MYTDLLYTAYCVMSNNNFLLGKNSYSDMTEFMNHKTRMDTDYARQKK